MYGWFRLFTVFYCCYLNTLKEFVWYVFLGFSSHPDCTVGNNRCFQRFNILGSRKLVVDSLESLSALLQCKVLGVCQGVLHCPTSKADLNK
jgi:hypothetical protein